MRQHTVFIGTEMLHYRSLFFQEDFVQIRVKLMKRICAILLNNHPNNAAIRKENSIT